MKSFLNLALICLLFLCFHVTELYSQSLPASANADLVQHLSADNGVIESGGYVSEWTDLSIGGMNATQPDGAHQPMLVSGAINGKPVIRFSAASQQYMFLGIPSLYGIDIDGYEIFIVAKATRQGVNKAQFLIGGANEQYEIHLDGQAGIRFIPNGPPYCDLGVEGDFSDNHVHIFSARASGTEATVRVDGVDGITRAGNRISSNDTQLGLGCRTVIDGVGSYLEGDIAEVLIYKRVLNGTERDAVEAYAKAKYAINSGALPVEINSFNASVKDNKALLSWETATEVNNYGFEIERASVSGKQNAAPEYIKVGFVGGSGNSNSKKEYTFADQSVPAGSHLYRLKQIDNNGSFKYYGPVNVSIETPNEFTLYQNSPNPFNPVTSISYNLPKQQNVTLKIYDQLGRLVNTIVDEVKQAGSYITYWNGRDSHGNIVSSGVYLYRLTAGEFSQSRKMNFAK